MFYANYSFLAVLMAASGGACAGYFLACLMMMAKEN